MNMKRFDFSKNEIKDLLITFIVLTISFSILCSEDFNEIPYLIPIVMIGVGLGSVIRETAVKMTATYFSYWAEYKTFLPGLVLAIFTSFGGFVFSAPGSVYVYGNATDKEDGLICLSGILSNILLTLLFFGLAVLIKTQEIVINGLSNELLFNIFAIGFLVNGSIAFFNSFPFGNLDGSAVFRWNPIIWLIVIAFILFVIWQGNTVFQI